MNLFDFPKVDKSLLAVVPDPLFYYYYRSTMKRKFPIKQPEIQLDTSQHTYRFFERFGFNVKQISKNGYGEGLDRYDMILK